MDGIGKPAINFRVNLVVMILNFGFMYIGLRYTGWLGAAYGADAAAIVSFVIMYVVLKKSVGIEMKEVVKWIWKSYIEIFGLLKKKDSALSD